MSARHGAAAAVAMLFLAAAPAARAELVEVQWSADGRFTHQGVVAAGKVLEVCGHLPAGLKLRWMFEAGAPLDFNIHYHAGKRVTYPAQRTAVTKTADTLATKTAQDYCWMWTNTAAADTRLELELQR